MIQLIPSNDVASISNFKEITKSYKYEMKPTKNQEVKLNQTLGTCRHLYNDSLAERKKGYENGGWNIQYNDQQNYLPILRNKNDETGKCLKDVQTQVLQNVLKRVDFAYQNFFRRVKNNSGNGEYKKPGFPRFKGYGRYDSFTFPQYGNGADIRIYKNNNDLNNKKSKSKDKHTIRLSKIGEIKYISHIEIGETKNKTTGKIEKIPYQIKTITIKKEVDKWFVVATVDTFTEIHIPTIPNQINSIEELNRKCVGIDMGLFNLTTVSTRKNIESQQYLRKSEKRLVIEQRKLSKKQKYEKIVEINKKINQGIKIDKEIEKKKIKVNSKNRDKQIVKVKKVHRKIVNQRRNFNHEVSRTLVDNDKDHNFDLIVFEKLNIQQMMSNHHYAKSIADASWYQIQMFTKYKAEWAGKMVDFVPSKNTTKECSKCHKINDMPIWKRTMICSCGNVEDRDVDASFVIRDRSAIYQDLKKKVLEVVNREAINSVGMQYPDFKPLERMSSVQSEMVEQVNSRNKETKQERTVANIDEIDDSIQQALPFRAG